MNMAMHSSNIFMHMNNIILENQKFDSKVYETSYKIPKYKRMLHKIPATSNVAMFKSFNSTKHSRMCAV